jgi:hypothetical protein
VIKTVRLVEYHYAEEGDRVTLCGLRMTAREADAPPIRTIATCYGCLERHRVLKEAAPPRDR